MNKRIVVAVIGVVLSLGSWAETFELFSFGNFDQWLTRNIKESKILGGHTKQLYAIAPTGTDNSGKAYTNRGGSPWPHQMFWPNLPVSPKLPMLSIPRLVARVNAPNSYANTNIARPLA